MVGFEGKKGRRRGPRTGDLDGFYCGVFSLSVSHTPAYVSILPFLTSDIIICSWLTGGTTIGSGLAYLAGGGTGKLLLKKLKLKEGEGATADSTDSKDGGEKEKKLEEEKKSKSIGDMEMKP